MPNDAVVDLGNILETPEPMTLDLMKAARAAIVAQQRGRRRDDRDAELSGITPAG